MPNLSFPVIAITLIALLIIFFVYRRYFAPSRKSSPVKKIFSGFLAYVVLPLGVNIISTRLYENYSSRHTKEEKMQANLERAEKTLLTAFSTSSNPISVREIAANGLGQLGKISVVKQLWNNEIEFFEIIRQYDTSVKVKGWTEINQQFILKLRSLISLSDANKTTLENDKKKLIVDNINTILIQLRNYREFFTSEKLSEDEKKEVADNKVVGRIDSLLYTLNETTKKLLPQRKYNFPGFIFDLKNAFMEIPKNDFSPNDSMLNTLKNISSKLEDLNRQYIEPLPEKPIIENYERIIQMLVAYGVKDALIEFRKTASNKDYTAQIRQAAIEAIGEVSDSNDLPFLCDLYNSEDNESVRISLLNTIVRLYKKNNSKK